MSNFECLIDKIKVLEFISLKKIGLCTGLSVGVGSGFVRSSASMNRDEEEDGSTLQAAINDGEDDGEGTNVVECLP